MVDNYNLVTLARTLYESGIQEIKIDSTGRLLYTSYSPTKKENIIPEEPSEEPEGPQFDPFEDPKEFDAPSDYEDPDMWQDGKKPEFSGKP